MRTIHKHPLLITDKQTIRVPETAHLLCAQLQGGQICIWAEGETEQPYADVDIYIFGTGHKMPYTAWLTYLSTVQVGGLVWHVYYGERR